MAAAQSGERGRIVSGRILVVDEWKQLRRKKGSANGQSDSIKEIAAGDVTVHAEGSVLWVHGILRLASLTGVGGGRQCGAFWENRFLGEAPRNDKKLVKRIGTTGKLLSASNKEGRKRLPRSDQLRSSAPPGRVRTPVSTQASLRKLFLVISFPLKLSRRPRRLGSRFWCEFRHKKV